VFRSKFVNFSKGKIVSALRCTPRGSIVGAEMGQVNYYVGIAGGGELFSLRLERGSGFWVGL
jgi:hypothetical protein